MFGMERTTYPRRQLQKNEYHGLSSTRKTCVEVVSVCDLKLFCVGPPISYQHSNGFNVETAKKPVIARVFTCLFSPWELSNSHVRYEKYEISIMVRQV